MSPNLATRTKDVTIEGTVYRVREPSAAEFALYLQTRIDGEKPKAITLNALDAADATTALVIQRCIIDPVQTAEQAKELAGNSVYGLALMAAIMGLGSSSRDQPQKEPDAG